MKLAPDARMVPRTPAAPERPDAVVRVGYSGTELSPEEPAPDPGREGIHLVAADRDTVTALVATYFGSDTVLEPVPGRTAA